MVDIPRMKPKYCINNFFHYSWFYFQMDGIALPIGLYLCRACACCWTAAVVTMSEPISPVPIRPFISSTFQDFQEERGYLNAHIFPELNNLCYQKGTYFAPVELRWGITKKEGDSGETISLCLNNIQRCEPFFICLVGWRYGANRSIKRPKLSINDEEKYHKDWLDLSFLRAAKYCGHEWVLDDSYQNSSVTELEIEEAAFRKRFKYCRFYFREKSELSKVKNR